MLNRRLHPSDEDLLLCADGELPARRAAQIRSHLTSCWRCRRRAVEMESTIAEFMRIHAQLSRPELPSIAGPRALLRARVAELARTTGQDRRSWISFSPNVRSLVYACALVLIIAFGTWLLYRHGVLGYASSQYVGLLPNPALTPGATRAMPIDAICSMPHDEVVLPVSANVQNKVFQEYGMQNASVENYEVDYLISPGLGGATDIRNLWPQPRYNTTWNSFVKDQLEEHLHQLVCGKQLSLATAQRDVSRDWISAYKKYFHTGTPLALHADDKVEIGLIRPQSSVVRHTFWIDTLHLATDPA